MLGTARRAPEEASVPAEVESRLRSSYTYEAAYLHLSRLLPSCRNCGCREFEPFQKAQVDTADAERSKRA